MASEAKGNYVRFIYRRDTKHYYAQVLDTPSMKILEEIDLGDDPEVVYKVIKLMKEEYGAIGIHPASFN